MVLTVQSSGLPFISCKIFFLGCRATMWQALVYCLQLFYIFDRKWSS